MEIKSFEWRKQQTIKQHFAIHRGLQRYKLDKDQTHFSSIVRESCAIDTLLFA